VIEIKGMIAHSGVLEIETEDVACACLKTASGALITIQVDYIQRHPMRRYHITGTEGTIIWELGDENVKLYTVGQPTPKIIDAPLGEVNDMYLDQIQHILDGIENTDERRLPITSIEAASEVTNLQLKLLSQT
jgi:predicted dehydrogenase